MAKLLSKITGSITTLILAATVLFYLVAGEAIRQAAPYVIFGAMAFFGVAGLIRLWFLFDAHRLQNKAIRAETADKIVQHKLASERAAWELKRDELLTQAAITQAFSGLIYPETVSDKPTFRAFPASTAKQAEKVLPGGEPAANLLDTLHDLQNILVVGGKGTGKTTLLQWLECLRQESGKTIVLDSHAQPAQWAGDVIGMGRQYALIKNAMVSLLDALNRRYELWSTGRADFQPIHTFIDEFTLLPKVLRGIGYDIQDYSIPMLTEGRKVAINCVWGIHSDRAAYLGLEGAKDLLECFDAVVYLKSTNEGRYALVDFGEGKQDLRYQLPGPFVKAQPAQITSQVATAEQPQPSILDLPVASDLQPTEQEQQVIDLWLEHKNWSKVHRIVTGLATYPGGTDIKRYKQILDKWQIDYN